MTPPSPACSAPSASSLEPPLLEPTGQHRVSSTSPPSPPPTQSVTQLGPPRGGTDVSSTPATWPRRSTSAGLPCSLLRRRRHRDLDQACDGGDRRTVDGCAGSDRRGDALESDRHGVAACALRRDHGPRIRARRHASMPTTCGTTPLTTYRAVGAHTTSMADDFAAGRRSEIDSFCGEISRLGRVHQVATPTHDSIGRLLIAREEQGGLR